MDPSQFSSFQRPKKKRAHAPRKTWSPPEEAALIDALKDLVANGWRADNAFRSGYLGQLENAMAKKFPHSHITGNKHINSKLTVWKKVYNQLTRIIDTSGFAALDPSTHMIEIDRDIWDEYVRVHPDVENLKNKSFPYYDDWCIIFGKDQANGKGACEFNDAILDLQHPHGNDDVVYTKHVLHGAKGKHFNGGVEDDPTVNLDTDDSDGETSINKASTSIKGNAAKDTKKTKGTKRKPTESITPDPLIAVVGDFFNKNNTILESLVSKYSSEWQVMSEKTKLVQEIVGKMLCLPMESRIRATHKIVSVPHNVDIFLNADDEYKAVFVQMMLHNQVI